MMMLLVGCPILLLTMPSVLPILLFWDCIGPVIGSDMAAMVQQLVVGIV